VLLHSPIVQVVGALLVGGLGLPIPEELVLMSAGYWLSRGTVEAPAMIVCAIAAMLAGDLIMYAAGRLSLGLARKESIARRLAQIERAFVRHGVKLILVGRFIPGVRAALLVAAGAARMPLGRLLACDAAAAIAGGAAWIALGWQLGPQLGRVRDVVGATHTLVAVVALLALAITVAARRQRG
jgi:membrane protein DedA with SNARE-associated domain